MDGDWVKAILPRLEGIDVNRLRRAVLRCAALCCASVLCCAMLAWRASTSVGPTCAACAAPAPRPQRCCSGGKTGQKAIAAAEAKASGAAEAEQQRAATAERRNTDDAVAAARARYLARKKAGGKK